MVTTRLKAFNISNSIGMEEMMNGVLGIRFPFNELRIMTNEFNDDNNVVKTQDFDLYRATITPQSQAAEIQHVTVKIWNSSDKLERFREEMSILGHPRVINCRNIATIIGYCCEGDFVATVYKLQAVDTLENLLDKDGFLWRDRMIAALGIAHIFRFIDVKRTSHLIHSTLPSYTILDQESNPVLCDVRVLVGGVGLLDEVAEGSRVRNDACSFGEEVTAGEMKPNGIFALGVLLLRLIRAKHYYLKDPKTKLPYIGVPSPSSTSTSVASCVLLESHCFYYRYDYHSVSSLVNQCLEYDDKCPTISQVVQTLENLLLFSLPVRKSCSKVVIGAQTLVYFTYSDLCELTDNFSKKSLFAITQFGEAYRGRIQQGWKEMGAQDIIVKMWEQLNFSKFCRQSKKSSLEDNICRLRDEVFLLTQSWMIDNPNVVKLLGYCFEDKKVGAVYSVKPCYTLESLFDDEWFEWKDRIVAALELARTIVLLHGKQYVVCNISGAHIMVDQDKKPILYDFSMLHGQVMSYGQKAAQSLPQIALIDYVDPYLMQTGLALPSTDIYTFGVLLMSLICKRDMYPVIIDFIYKHVEDEFKSKSSFVDKSFVIHPFYDPDDEHKLSVLAMDCLEVEYPLRRPTANEIVQQLQSLHFFSNTLFSTHVIAKVVDVWAKIERKPSLWRNLKLFKKMSIKHDEHKKRKVRSSQELAKQKEVEGPKVFRPVIFEKNPEEIQLIDASLKRDREEFERRMAVKKDMAKLSQSNFVKQLVGV